MSSISGWSLDKVEDVLVAPVSAASSMNHKFRTESDS
jgi:hypothetical protein